jgi:hypothetical protein
MARDFALELGDVAVEHEHSARQDQDSHGGRDGDQGRDAAGQRLAAPTRPWGGARDGWDEVLG